MMPQGCSLIQRRENGFVIAVTTVVADRIQLEILLGTPTVSSYMSHKVLYFRLCQIQQIIETFSFFTNPLDQMIGTVLYKAKGITEHNIEMTILGQSGD